MMAGLRPGVAAPALVSVWGYWLFRPEWRE
jgi:hypothetical protein